MIKIVTAIFFLFVSNITYAGTGAVQGQVSLIRSHDPSIGYLWFQLDSPSAGACGTVGGKVIFRIKDNENGKHQLSMVLAAKMAGKSVVVGYDDVNLISGQYCYVRYLDI